ncbi:MULTISPECIES: hypothetical protein [Micrococcaceae]|nr:hypothetical protein [Arthrobacter sp. H16F315]MDD1475349.1 hypothetical protein [Arthrobacter sp. H16F315]
MIHHPDGARSSLPTHVLRYRRMSIGMDLNEQNQRQPENRSANWMEVLLFGGAIHLIEIGMDRLGVLAGLMPPG